MEATKVEQFLLTNKDLFPANKLLLLKEKLLTVPDEKFILISSLDYKNPTTILIVSIFLGGFGIDRFMVGDKGAGILKLLTGGLCGVLTIVDWFSISGKAKEKNFNELMSIL